MSRIASAQATPPAGLWLRLKSAAMSPCSQCHSGASLLLVPVRQGWESNRLPERQCTYSVTQRCVRVNIAVVESNIFSVCDCSRSYPACKVQALYYTVICGLSGPAIFFSHDFRKKKQHWTKNRLMHWCGKTVLVTQVYVN